MIHLAPQCRLLWQPLIKPANRLPHGRVIQSPGQLSQWRQTQSPGPPTQPKGGIASPISMPTDELTPALPFGLLHHGDDPGPTHRWDQPLKLTLLPGIAHQRPPQIPREGRRPQHQPTQKVAPIRLRPEDRLPFVTARRHMLAPPRNAPPVMLVPYLLSSAPHPQCQASLVNC